MATVTLKVKGMSCDHCVRSVTEALQRVDGVERANVDLNAGRAVVEYREGTATPRSLESAVMDEGYTAEEVA